MDASATAADQKTKSWSQRANELTDTSVGEFWQPIEGDAIGGRLTDIEHNTGTKSDSTIYTLEDETGKVRSFWGSAVIDKRLKNCEVGDLVLIKYLGRKQSAAGTEYKNFAISHEKMAFSDDLLF